jgi:LmbE family N-acetylglucosaminyl deacetylase
VTSRPDVRLVHLPHLDSTTDPPTFLGSPLAGGAAFADLVALGAVVEVPVPADGLDHLPDAVVVAPHPDDAVLALGAALAGSTASVVTVFSDETWTRLPYYAERPELARATLVAEDVAALGGLGVPGDYLGYVDAADRPAWSDGFLCDDVARVRAAEPDLLRRLTAELGARLAGAPLAVAPLGVGGHVDHLLCREAVRDLHAAGRVGDVAFYADMPYAALALGGRTAALPDVGLPLAEWTVAATPERLAAKAAVLSCYRLQVAAPVARRVLLRPERLFRVQGDQVR